MALTKISRGLLDTGVSDSSDATAITIDSSENVGFGTTGDSNQMVHVSNYNHNRCRRYSCSMQETVLM